MAEDADAAELAAAEREVARLAAEYHELHVLAEKVDVAGEPAQAARLRDEAEWSWRQLITARSRVAILRAQRTLRPHVGRSSEVHVRLTISRCQRRGVAGVKTRAARERSGSLLATAARMTVSQREGGPTAWPSLVEPQLLAQ